MALQCLIVDDNQEFLDAARTLLEREGLRVAGVASTGADALRQVEELRPDVVLLDVSLGDENGIELARRLGVAPAVILISTRSEVEFADVAPPPAVGFISKSNLSAAAVIALLHGC